MSDESRILDAGGRPFQLPARNGKHAAEGEMVLRAVTQFATAISRLQMPAFQRARDPFGNNPWVYACAIAIAVNATQAPYKIWRETDKARDTRVTKLKSMNRWEGTFQSGRRRTAVSRFLSQSGRTRWGLVARGLELDDTHPLNEVIEKPNALMSAAQLWFLTHLWFAVKGEAFWLLLDEKGDLTSYASGKVRYIWPVNPNYFHEIIENNTLTGWRVRVGRGTAFEAEGREFPAMFDEVIHFYRPDPANPLRGLEPLTAAAAQIYTDSLIAQHTMNTLMNGGQPAGVLFHEGPMKPFGNKEEEEEFRQKWQQRHGEADRAKGVALLTGGWKYVQVGMSPRDMEWSQLGQYDRDIILAVMETPKSVLSITDGLNYATQLSQDRNFWDKNLMPRMRGFEDTLDATLLYPETDDIVGGFDFSGVEALKVGISEKVRTILSLCSPSIHMPPKNAGELVGLELPAYDGDDMALITAGLTTVDAVLEGTAPAPPGEGGFGGGQPGMPALPGSKPPALPGGKPEGSEPPALGGGEQKPAATPKLPFAPKSLAKLGVDKTLSSDYNPDRGALVRVVRGARSRKAKRDAWARLMRRVQQPYEKLFIKAWRRFIAAERQLHLTFFDKRARELGLKTIVERAYFGDPGTVLLALSEMQGRLSKLFRPIYADELEDVFEQTVEEIGGVAVFEMDDPAIVEALDRREEILVGSAPETIQNNVRASIRKGIEKGETVQEMRDRVAKVYDISASSAKSLAVARTESAGFMNDARESMFDLQGFENREWSNAGDEHVRKDHVTFGSLGPKPVGYNYLDAVGKADEGILERPSDERAPADQVVNCRCVHLPA